MGFNSGLKGLINVNIIRTELIMGITRYQPPVQWVPALSRE
jgi:hypothetical protein